MTEIEKELVKRLLVQAFRQGKVHVKLDLPKSIPVTQRATPPPVSQEETQLNVEGVAVTPRPEGCLCHLCPSYESCDLGLTHPAMQRPHVTEMSPSMTQPLTKEVDMEPELPVSQPSSTPTTWQPKEGISPAMSQVLQALDGHLEGLKVREIVDATELSRRHIYRVLEALREAGLIEKSGSRWILTDLDTTKGENDL